jgi:inositol-hexakisphosphate 5-kinase
MSNPPAVSKRPTLESGKGVTAHNGHSSTNSSSPQSPPSPRYLPRLTNPETASSSDKEPLPVPFVTSDHVRRAGLFGDHSHLLSERESIFATHYLPSDGNDQTPQLPAAEGAGDVDNLTQDITTAMETPPPLTPPQSVVSLESLLPTRKSLNKHASIITPNSQLQEESRGTIRTVHRVASKGQSANQVLQLRVTKQKHSTTEDRAIDSTRNDMSRVVHDGDGDGIGDVNTRPVLGSSQSKQDRGSAIGDTIRQSGATQRSSSHGRTHVEKSIEATLPHRAPTKNVRTRKSSYLMGIFKETTSSDTSRRDGQPRASTSRLDEGEEAPVSVQDPGTLEGQPKSNLAMRRISPVKASSAAASRVDFSHPAFGGDSTELQLQPRPNISTMVSGATRSCSSTPASPTRSYHDPYFRKRDQRERITSGKTPAIPAKLLEEIRTHHSLSPSDIVETVRSPTGPSLTSVDANEQSTRPVRSPAEGTVDEHEEDEEHISSAVYFPHSGPTDEDIEHFGSLEEEQDTEIHPSLSLPSISALPADGQFAEGEAPISEHIDISVKSKHEKSVFHGNYRPAEEPDQDARDTKSVAMTHQLSTGSASSTSETGLSSEDEFDDFHPEEDGDLTPTKIPLARSHSQRKRRAASSNTPKGAVLLEPYSHQVGGHSTIFRFSRRAVCKQLNNRENEFYERIEQRHPDMLRFLPRFVHIPFAN